MELAEEEQREIDAAWAEYRRLESEKADEENRKYDDELAEYRAQEDYDSRAREALLEELCPCGHSYKFHGSDGDGCQFCSCFGFGDPHEVNVGDGPGGFKIYE